MHVILSDEEIREEICRLIRELSGVEISPNEIDFLEGLMMEMRLDADMELDYSIIKAKILAVMVDKDVERDEVQES